MPATEITAGQVWYAHPDETNGVLVDGRGVLRQGEVFTGSPTVSTSSGPTISSASITSTMQLINGKAVEPGKAISFSFAGGSDGSTYMVKISCGTSASRTRVMYLKIPVAIPTATNP